MIPEIDTEKRAEIETEEDIIELTITPEDEEEFRRLDHYLTAKLPYSRQFLKNLFEKGSITTVSDRITLTLKKMVKAGTVIEVHVPPPIPAEALPENIPLDILYEDEHLIFLNKQAGLVVHPAPGNMTGTLVNALLHHCPELKGIGGVKRPGIVHRLDKGTSGVMVVAKDAPTHEGLILLFSTHTILRRYEALVLGGERLPKSGKIESLIGRHPAHRQKMSSNVKHGRKAITHFKVLHNYIQEFGFTHIELELETGRTHQIRVHLSEKMNAPILMDPLYGNPETHLKKLEQEEHKLILKDYPYPLLHAKTLGLVHPITKKYLEFTTKAPHPWAELLPR